MNIVVVRFLIDVGWCHCPMQFTVVNNNAAVGQYPALSILANQNCNRNDYDYKNLDVEWWTAVYNLTVAEGRISDD